MNPEIPIRPMNAAAPSKKGIRAALACMALAFVGLFVVNTFVQSADSQAQAAKYFSSGQIERGLQFSYERKLLQWCGVGLQLALLTVLVCTPLSRQLTNFFDRCTGQRWVFTLLLVGATYLVLSELVALPLGLVRLEHSRVWQMTQRGVDSWLIDWAKSLVLVAGQGMIGFVGLYSLIWLFPRMWWVLGAAAGTGLAVIYAIIMPEFIDPLFYEFKPLDDPYLLARVRTLAEQADVPIEQVLVLDASSRGRHTNAYFTGFGATRRVVLYDTLLQSHSGIEPSSIAGAVGLVGASWSGGPMLASSEILSTRALGVDELETILAHELGHWRHDHIVKGIALGGIGLLFGMFLLSRILPWAVGRQPFCLASVRDPVGLPLILLLAMLGSWLTLPVQNGISRYFERQADATSLELAQNPSAFIEAEKRLARDNLSNVAPVPINVWMFSTHPPAVERIEMAEQWRKQGP